ncbi:MAG TPA: 4a-hydroxytetrahydrobiopterin dehydratase [Aggregatilinea sp.]|jgi:4a-hydroxytetrahydrobiopterin dehydratase|uniref:4a-hydroxytetrahydrobiopterin dehydratase n=1 Tax=Aggregatilinea sp. TaxID=2806333 RepID=UPI002BE13F68|nr:4a-hydroxytetrahydrobiopterin dehydratase [Aggregatilinea sp.]HML24805.1 4a-hydroxytetrahydrobiopterin dehydratase [Aggregatilinea sp.]
MPLNPDIYTDVQIQSRLQEYADWRLEGDGQLHAEFTFKNFRQAVLFVNAIAHLAEVADHHPDLCIHDYKQVSIRIMTHSAGGITSKDFDLIAQIEALPRYAA